MCIAIVKPVGTSISKETLEACFINNSDGAGFAYIDTDVHGVRRLKTRKSMDFESFYSKYEKAQVKASDSPFLIHFRIKTHGGVNIENCHPFRINKRQVFIHNGIISGIRKDAAKSDTRIFNEDCLRKLPRGWETNPALKLMIESFIGYSKIAVLNLNGTFQIFNEGKGEWVNGVWYSNTSYKPKAVVNYSYGYNYGYEIPVRTTHKINGSTSVFSKTDRSYGRSFKDGIQDVPWGSGVKKDIGHRVTPYSLESFIVCDCCGAYKQIDEMECLYDSKSIYCFCQECQARHEVWYYIEPEAMVDNETFVEWLNESLNKSTDTKLHKMSMKWENPWTSIDNSADNNLPVVVQQGV